MWDDLTKVQQETLEFIIDYIKTNSIPPTYQEIAKANKVTIKSVAQRLVQLSKKGYISLKKNIPRGISLTEKVGFSIPQQILLKVFTSCKKVKSSVKLYQPEGNIFLPKDFLSSDDEHFFVFKLSDNSVIHNHLDINLPLGTLIVVEKIKAVNDGDKVICIHENDIILGVVKELNGFPVIGTRDRSAIPIGGNNATVVGKIWKIIISF